MPEAFPFFMPSDARRLFTGEGLIRRVARTCHWPNGARLLELVPSPAGLQLVRELDAEVILADTDSRTLDSWRERAKAQGLGDQLQTQQVSWGALPFPDEEFDGILSLGRVMFPLEAGVHNLRKLLAPKGRLVFTFPVKTGLKPAAEAVSFWKQRVGSEILSPRETLMAIERQGYEPETLETAGDAELDEYYRDLETQLSRLTPEQTQLAKNLVAEINLQKQLAGRSGVSLAVIVARRKEPGERPPPSRDGG